MFKSPTGIQDHVRHVHNSIPHKPTIVTAEPDRDNRELKCTTFDPSGSSEFYFVLLQQLNSGFLFDS